MNKKEIAKEKEFLDYGFKKNFLNDVALKRLIEHLKGEVKPDYDGDWDNE